MKDLKFRVWISDGDFRICPSDRFSLCLHDTGHILQFWCSDGIVEEIPVIKIDQFTSLKDKNDADIFEGDIVKIHRHHQYHNGKKFDLIEVVEFSGAGFEPFAKPYSYDFDYYQTKEIEIIGNICQNKDLIERDD